jgi:hypothetical protein
LSLKTILSYIVNNLFWFFPMLFCKSKIVNTIINIPGMTQYFFAYIQYFSAWCFPDPNSVSSVKVWSRISINVRWCDLIITKLVSYTMLCRPSISVLYYRGMTPDSRATLSNTIYITNCVWLNKGLYIYIGSTCFAFKLLFYSHCTALLWSYQLSTSRCPLFLLQTSFSNIIEFISCFNIFQILSPNYYAIYVIYLLFNSWIFKSNMDWCSRNKGTYSQVLSIIKCSHLYDTCRITP